MKTLYAPLPLGLRYGFAYKQMQKRAFHSSGYPVVHTIKDAIDTPVLADHS